MKTTAIVIGAGRGTWMYPFSLGTPKSLLKFCLRPLVEYTLEELHRHGIVDVVLVYSTGTG